jgi:hypothetical protein
VRGHVTTVWFSDPHFTQFGAGSGALLPSA